MENRAHALAAGLFVLILGAALIAAGMWFGKDEIRQDYYVITTSQSVAGLKVEAPVRYRGVEVGRVESIRIEPGTAGRIRIRIGVEENTPVTAGTYAQLGYQGVTGLAYVSLNDDGKSTQLLGKSGGSGEAQIPLKASLLDSGEVLVSSAMEIADRLKELLGGDNQKAVKKTLAGLENLFSDDNQKLIRRSIASLDDVAKRAATLAERMEPGVRDLPALLADARSTAQKADQLLTNLNSLSLKLEQRIVMLDRVATTVDDVGGAARTVADETLPRLNALAEDLGRETRALDRLINTLGDNPQSVIFGSPGPRPGPGEPGFNARGAK